MVSIDNIPIYSSEKNSKILMKFYWIELKRTFFVVYRNYVNNMYNDDFSCNNNRVKNKRKSELKKIFHSGLKFEKESLYLG